MGQRATGKVCLVCLVRLVCLVYRPRKPDRPKKPDEQERRAGLVRLGAGLAGLLGRGRDERALLVYLVGGAEKTETMSGFGGSYEF